MLPTTTTTTTTTAAASRSRGFGDESKRRRRRWQQRPKTWCCLVMSLLSFLAVLRWCRRKSEDDEREASRHRLRPLGSAAGPLDRWASRIAGNGVDEHFLRVSEVAHSIGGRVAVVLDNAVPEKERRRVADRYIKLTGASAQDGWHREKASDLSLEHNAMAKDMPYDECDSDVLTVIRTVVPHFYEQCDPAKPVWVTRCSIYMQSFIDVDEAHEDRSHDAVGFSVTAIWYPHERWHSAWGGETVFLTKNAADADLLLPVLPKPRRLLLFDSEITHMAKPTSPISEPFSPTSIAAYATLPTTRTNGNRFSFVLRTLCGRDSVEDLLDRFDKNYDHLLSRTEAINLFRHLDVDRIDGALHRLAKVAKSNVQLFNADHLKAFFDIRDDTTPRNLPDLNLLNGGFDHNVSSSSSSSNRG